MDITGTSTNIPLSLSLDTVDYYRDHVTRGEHVVPDDIENGDQPNYGELSQGNDSEPNNAEGGECPYDSSSSDDDEEPDIFMDMHENDFISTNVLLEPTDFLNENFYLPSKMLFKLKEDLQRAVRLYHFKEGREFFVVKSGKEVFRICCKRAYEGCLFKLCTTKNSSNNLWKIGKYIEKHTCNMGDCRGGHFNLDINVIAAVLYPIKDCQTSILNKYRKIISHRKAYLGRKRAFELVYENWEGSFYKLPRFMVAMKHVNPGFIDEWRFEQHKGVDECVFNYVFWMFKPCVDGFRYCWPVISIDGIHVYGKYDIKLLIAVGTDGNGSIFPLAFAVVENESLNTWTKFLHDLHEHVVCGRQGITWISDKHHGILESVSIERNWQSPFAYHRYCLRHLKENYQRGYKSVRLNNLLWAATTATGEKRFLLRMELIKETHLSVYEWLMNIELEKWTLHKDDGRRWGMLTKNSSESFNGLLKSA
ncbi:uncharacterized protein LOC124887418 [Capsicum annuum]|uniref:uncharacterized protein LOC124887418 n=1 Tax=Capsicum annuum TaxID=4072 RepID=UPI001FB0CCA0|nr:uncharacterized protein LOC124887418 [Capsicum annuum]